jgi:hypothetical protein
MGVFWGNLFMNKSTQRASFAIKLSSFQPAHESFSVFKICFGNIQGMISKMDTWNTDDEETAKKLRDDR